MKNTKAIWIGVFAIILAVILIVVLKKPVVPQNSGAIKIGAVLSLTGSASADGEALKQGIEFAKEELSKKGVSVEVVYEDDKTESADTVSAINALSVRNVQAIIGPTWSFLGDAAVPVIDRLKIVSVMPVTTTEVVNGKSEYLFHGSIKNALMKDEFTAFIKEKNIKKIAFIGNDDAWSGSILAPLAESAAANGAEIVIKEQVPFGSEAASMPSVLTKIKQQKPDVIIFSIFDDQGISKLVNGARQQGLMVPIIATDTSLRRVVSEGLLGNTSLENLYDITPESDGSFEKAYEARYGVKPKTFTDRGYDALMILVDAIQNKKDMSLKDYLHTKTNYKGYATTYTFDMNGDVKGGQWQLMPLQ
jgi:branched-chain amino acid transport system substrate-binding protein